MSGIRVGWIEPAFQAGLPDVSDQFRPREREEEPNHPALDWRHARQAGWSRPGQHSHEHGLHLIVGVMRRQNDFRTHPPADRFEPGVSPDSSQGFTGRGAQHELRGLERKGVGSGQGSHLVRHPATVGMDAMVQVGDDEGEPMQVSGSHQQIQECDRIRPTGDGNYRFPLREVHSGKMAAESVDQAHGSKFNANLLPLFNSCGGRAHPRGLWPLVGAA